MAVTVTDLANGVETSVSTTISTGATVTGTTANGDWFVVLLATCNHNDLPPYASVTDTAGNTYTSRVNFEWPTGASIGDGTALAIFTAPVTVNITNGTITATRSYSSGLDQLIQVYRVRPAAGQTLSFVTANDPGSGSSATSHSAATVSVANGDIIFGAASIETNDPVTGDSDTLNGSWSTILTRLSDHPNDVDSTTLSSQYKQVTATGNQSWACSTTSARDSTRSYVVLHSTGAAFSITAAQGSYALSGTAATLRKSKAPLAAAAGSYVLTGTAATPLHGWLVSAATGSYALTGTAASSLHGWKFDATAGSYALTGTDAGLVKTTGTGKVVGADPGAYALTGTAAALLHSNTIVAGADSYVLTGTAAQALHAWRVAAGDESPALIGDLLIETSDFLLLETGDRLVFDDAGGTIAGGSYILTGSAVGLNATTGNKTLAADPGTYTLTGTSATLTAGHVVTAGSGTYLLTGTAATLTASVPAATPIRAIGEPPIAKDQRRRREVERARALEQQRKARDRLKRAIGRLLEGLPPEFDEPEQLAQAENNAIQAFNLLRAMQAPWQELNAVNELIDHIRQLRIAQPIAQLALAQAYNRSHRHLQKKAAEDVVMALLLGE